MSLVPLAVAASMGVELAAVSAERARLQAAVDAAALTGARSLAVSGANARDVSEHAERFAFEQIPDLAERGGLTIKAGRTDDGGFAVDGLFVRPSFFGDMVPKGGFKINARAVAEALNQTPLCVMARDVSNARSGLTAEDRSAIRAPGCIIHANNSIELSPEARLEAGIINSGGTAVGANYSPAANSGALTLTDPFASMSITMPSPCPTGSAVTTNTYGAGVHTLPPGQHMGRVIVEADATLRLAAGEHHFCFAVDLRERARLEGEDVAMIFANNQGNLIAREGARVALRGRRTGPYAGFVLVARGGNYAALTISSSEVDELLGTIYMPSSHVVVNSAADVAEDSQWSVVVARNINLSKQAQLVINADYDGSPVPVPLGVGNRAHKGGGPRLRQ